ncbi:30S ribosomal protein S5 [bacterium]|nr:MAG: 30S ribosomal protein S5 [bacterium]RIK64924.1 MAG: 30S ribosomal protein S5 [Planctomycetota bacterium]
MKTRVLARDVDLGEEKVIGVTRTAAVAKGGRRFSFTAVVVMGDMRGVLGLGQGKAREVPNSIEKAVRDARKNLVRYPLRGDTIPHAVWGRFGASRVYLRPAAPGTGIKAGATVRSVAEALGIRNLLTKAYGSRNPTNLVKAVLDGLNNLRSKEEVFKLRGLPVLADRDRPKLEVVEELKRDQARREKGDKRDGRSGDKRDAKGPRGGTRGPRGKKGDAEAKADAPEAKAEDKKDAEGEAKA